MLVFMKIQDFYYNIKNIFPWF